MTLTNEHKPENDSPTSDWAYLQERIRELIAEVEKDIEKKSQTSKDTEKFVATVDSVWEKLCIANNELTGGKRWVNAKEVYDLRAYAKQNTNFSVTEELITDEQKVWRFLYKILDDMLGELMGSKEKAAFDALEKKRDDFLAMKSHLEEKLRRDGDDTNKGIASLILFSVFGAIVAWYIYPTIAATVIGIVLFLIIGEFFIVFILKNSWACWRFGRWLREMGISNSDPKLIQIGERFMASAHEIKNKN
jgi:hypothetical protein